MVAYEDEGRLDSVEQFQALSFGFIGLADVGPVTVAQYPGKEMAIGGAVAPCTYHCFWLSHLSIGENPLLGKVGEKVLLSGYSIVKSRPGDCGGF